jgi:fucose permease
MVIVNSVVIVRTHLDLGAAAVGIAFGASGAGSMVVALMLPRLLGRIAERTLMLTAGAVLGAGLIAAAAAAVDRYETLLLVWFVLGAGASAINTPAGRLLRRSSSVEDRPA